MIETVLKRYAKAKTKNDNFSSTWESVRNIFAPYQEMINGEESEGGEFDFSKIWTSVPIEAVRVFVSGLQSYLTPSNAQWVSFRMRNAELTKTSPVKKFLEETEKEVAYTLSNSNFDAAIAEGFLQSVLYGSTTMTIDRDETDRVRYTTLPIMKVFFTENSAFKVTEYFIEQNMTAESAAEKFGYDKLHPDMRKEIDNCENINKLWLFIYHIKERAYYDKEKKDKDNMPIGTKWIDFTNKYEVKTGGFRQFPIATHRFYKRSTSALGYSPCMLALAEGRMLNSMSKTNLRGGMKLADPAIAVPSKGFITKINNNPNAVNIYQKDVNKDSVFQLPGGGGVPFTMDMEMKREESVRRLLFNDVFRAISGITKQMNNPEVQQIIQEALTQIGPALGRFQAEYLDNIIATTVSILASDGFLPPPPPEMLEGMEYEIEYTSTLAMMQKRGNINTIYQAFGALEQIAAFDPAVLDNFNADEAWRISTETLSIPATISRDEVQVSEIRTSRANLEAKQTEIAGAEQGAKIAKDLSGVQQ